MCLRIPSSTGSGGAEAVQTVAKVTAHGSSPTCQRHEGSRRPLGGVTEPPVEHLTYPVRPARLARARSPQCLQDRLQVCSVVLVGREAFRQAREN